MNYLNDGLKEAPLMKRFDKSKVPEGGLVLGVSSDGLPVLLNLSSGNSGQILFSSSHPRERKAFLSYILDSLEHSYNDDRARAIVVSNDDWYPESFLIGARYSSPVEINGFLNLCKDFMNRGDRWDAKLVLLIDDVYKTILSGQGRKGKLIFKKIVEDGEKVGVHLIATKHPDDHALLSYGLRNPNIVELQGLGASRFHEIKSRGFLYYERGGWGRADFY